MTMQSKTIVYKHNGLELEAYMAWDDKHSLPCPGVLICHDAMGGKSDFERERARALAELGYVGIAIDLYGKDHRASSAEEAYELMNPLIDDKQLLRERLAVALEMAASRSVVDSEQIAAIGYCFGGMCALEYARSGAALKAVASFHGLLSASSLPSSNDIKAKILVLHGWSDSIVPENQVAEFCQEMTQAKADWQLVVYGQAMHSFTNPQAHDPDNGIGYNPLIEKRSWLKLQNFLTEVFG